MIASLVLLVAGLLAVSAYSVLLLAVCAPQARRRGYRDGHRDGVADARMALLTRPRR